MKMSGDDLPEDIVEEISLRLPVKSLLRFKSIAKSWNERIANPYFISKQFNSSESVSKIHHQQLILRLHNLNFKPCLSLISDQETKDVELPFPEKEVEYICVYGQCHGIFCLDGVYYGGDNKAGRSSLILWNPGTKQVKVLPPSQNQPKDMVYIMFGFGIDPATKDYKVVRFGTLDLEERELPPVEVYNLSTNSWRTIDAVVPAFRLCYPKCRAYLNGFYHWLTHDNDRAILFFDFTKEVFGKIQLPLGVDRSDELDVAVIDEKLACIATYTTNHRFEIWVMNEYGVESGWKKKSVIGPCPEFGSFLELLGDDEILLEAGCQFVSYNIKNQQIKGFEIHGIPKMFNAFGYSESSVPLNI